jgi:hypothetical protein
MARDRGEAVCDAVCWWALRRRRAKRRDERPEGPGRSKTEVPAESRGDRYWSLRSRAYSREATMSKCMSAALGSRQGGWQLEEACCPLVGSVSPIVGLCVVERHHATWDLAGNTAILQGVCQIRAGLEQSKKQEDEKLLLVVCRWIEIGLFLASFVKENVMDRGGLNNWGVQKMRLCCEED